MIAYYKRSGERNWSFLFLWEDMKWWKEKGYRSLSSWEAKERETKNQIETDSEECFGLTGEGNGDGTKQIVVSRCCERRYALKGAVMTTTISTGNLTILFLFFRRCCQDNTLWEQPYVCKWKADYRIYSVTIRWMLTTTNDIDYMIHISLKTIELSVVVVSRISVSYVKYIWNIAYAVVFLWPNQIVMHSRVGRCLKWQFLI